MTDLERELLDALERTETIVERMVATLLRVGAFDARLEEDVFDRQKHNADLIVRASKRPSTQPPSSARHQRSPLEEET